MSNRVSQHVQQNTIKQCRDTALPGYVVECHDATRRVVINHVIVRCTALEYQLLKYFLQHAHQPLPFEVLTFLIDDQASKTPTRWKQVKRKLIKAVSELRGKLWPCQLVLVYANGAGYMLVHHP